jgi:hypothetical protein
LKLAQHFCQLSAIHKFKWFALSEPQCFVGVNAAGDEDRPASLFRRHDAEKFPDGLDTHLIRLPPLALDDGGRAVAAEPEVNSAISTTSTNFLHLKTVLAIHLGHLLLEALPSQLVQPADVQMLLEESCAFLPDAPSGGKAYEGRSSAQWVTEYLQLWNCHAVLEPNRRNAKEKNRRDQYAPRRVDHREKPAQGFKEVVP